MAITKRTVKGAALTHVELDANFTTLEAVDAALAATDATLASADAAHAALTEAHGATGAVVGTTNTQTLTNKTIVAASNTITTAASGNLTATSLNAALAELQGDIDTRATSAGLAADTGSTLVGDDDGASGSLWTTIKGFITYLRSSLGSSLVGFIQSGTGAVATTVQTALRETVSVKRFGAVGNGIADDTAAIQAALNSVAAAQGMVQFPSGTYRFTGNLVPPLGVSWSGTGPTFGCVLLADGPNASIKMVGSESGSGGFVFRQYFRNISLRVKPGSVMAGVLVDVDMGYNIEFHHIHVDMTSTVAADVPAGGVKVFSLATANAITLANIVIRGATDLSTQAACVGVDVTGVSSVRIENSDIEVMNRGVKVGTGGVVDIISPYMERNIVGVDNNGAATTVVNIGGGRILVPNNSCQGVRMSVSGGVTNIDGTYLKNELGTNLVYSWTGSKGMYYDSTNARLRLGTGTTGGGQIDAPPYTITLNANSTPGAEYGFGLGQFVQCIGEASTFTDDWELRYLGAGNKTARFFAPGAGVFSIYSDGVITAGRSISSGRVSLTYGSTITIDASLGNTFVITPTDAVAYTLNVPGGSTTGQKITIQVVNSTAGALGAMTWAAGYKMAAWTQPATGFSRSVTFVYNGTVWTEIGRTSGDIPN